MNCENCGAPLTPVPGRDYCCCTYCATFHFPTTLADSADGLKPLGTKADCDCPVCHARLAVGSIVGRRVQYCERCRGVLASTDDFAGIVAEKRSQWTGPSSRPSPIDPEEFNRKVHCPRCKAKMDAHPYYGPGSVVMDSCGRCRVVWLDHGEIAAIESAPGRR